MHLNKKKTKKGKKKKENRKSRTSFVESFCTHKMGLERFMCHKNFHCCANNCHLGINSKLLKVLGLMNTHFVRKYACKHFEDS